MALVAGFLLYDQIIQILIPRQDASSLDLITRMITAIGTGGNEFSMSVIYPFRFNYVLKLINNRVISVN